MNYLPSIFFLVVALVQAGVYLMSFVSVCKETYIKGQKFYEISLIFGALCSLGLAISILPSNQGERMAWILTPASIAYLATFFSILLFCIAQLRPIGRTALVCIALFILGWGFCFEYFRRNGDFFDRSLLVLIPLCLIYLVQCIVLSRILRHEYSRQMRALQIITFMNLLLALIRLAAFHFKILPGNFLFEQFPALLVLAICLQFSLHLLEITAINGFWVAEVVRQRREVQLENQRIADLIIEKEALIKSLSRLQVVAETGALSASLAHEINQPLSAIQLDAQMLQGLLSENKASAEIQSFLQRILINNARAAQNIQSLSNLFISKNATSTIGQVDLIIGEALKLISVQIQRSNVRLEKVLDAPVPTLVVPQELQMVLINLINNSCEALRDTPNAIIQLKSWQTETQTCIEVSDNGPGIAAPDQANVFMLLKTSKAEGSGIGLWLSRYLIEKCGGRLSLESEAEAGAKFLITLPRSGHDRACPSNDEFNGHQWSKGI